MCAEMSCGCEMQKGTVDVVKRPDVNRGAEVNYEEGSGSQRLMMDGDAKVSSGWCFKGVHFIIVLRLCAPHHCPPSGTSSLSKF